MGTWSEQSGAPLPPPPNLQWVWETLHWSWLAMGLGQCSTAPNCVFGGSSREWGRQNGASLSSSPCPRHSVSTLRHCIFYMQKMHKNATQQPTFEKKNDHSSLRLPYSLPKQGYFITFIIDFHLQIPPKKSATKSFHRDHHSSQKGNTN